MVSIVLDSLPQGTGNLVKPDELAHLLHLCVIARCCGVQPRYDGGHITKYGGVKKCWQEKIQINLYFVSTLHSVYGIRLEHDVGGGGGGGGGG